MNKREAKAKAKAVEAPKVKTKKARKGKYLISITRLIV